MIERKLAGKLLQLIEKKEEFNKEQIVALPLYLAEQWKRLLP